MPLSHRTLDEERLFVLYDAGETNALRPVLEQLEAERKSFKFLVMGTAELLIPKNEFIGKRLELSDFEITEQIDQTTPRETKLSQDSLQKLLSRINPHALIVGTASKIQQQILKIFKHARRIAFVDNFYYDQNNPTFETVNIVQQSAALVLCPSLQTLNQLRAVANLPQSQHSRTYQIVGKPTIEVWAQRIEHLNQETVFRKLGFNRLNGPIVTIVCGGHGQMQNLLDSCAAFLRQKGYQAILQVHPKISKSNVEIIEALAVSDFVAGFNSSVIFDSLLIGKKAIYIIPEGNSFDHFAIQSGYAKKAANEEGLLTILQNQWTQPTGIKNALQMPDNSVKAIIQAIDEAMS